MKRLLSFLFGRRARKIMLPSLVQQWQDDDAVLSRMISQQWHAAGVQALFQIMETEAAAETQLALADPPSSFHAGGARVLLNILTELQKLDPALRQKRSDTDDEEAS